MTAPTAPSLPFPVFQVSQKVERYLLYDVNVITWLRKNHNILGVLNLHLFRDVRRPADGQWQNLFPLLCIILSLLCIPFPLLYILSRFGWIAFYDSHRCHRVRRLCVRRAFWIERFRWTKSWYSSNLIDRTSELDSLSAKVQTKEQ